MSRRKRSKIRNERRRIIDLLVQRHGLLCSLCCYPMKRNAYPRRDPDAITIDHRVPRARGGDNHIGNLQLAHRRCNTLRGAEPWSGGPEAP